MPICSSSSSSMPCEYVAEEPCYCYSANIDDSDGDDDDDDDDDANITAV